MVPSFAIIGAQRAGTTSLFDDLLRHPDVSGPSGGEPDSRWPEKEVDFFSNRFYEGLDWYRAFFPTVVSRERARKRGGDLVAGEATPYYLFHPAAAERMAVTLPDVRLIALLRDPIARAYSHYQLVHRIGGEKLSFEDALAAEGERLAGEADRLRSDPRYLSRPFRRHSYFTRGLYADQLERWFAHFPRGQFLVLFAEDYFARPGDVYDEGVAFIGARPRKLDELRQATKGWAEQTAAVGTVRNRASYDPIDPDVRARLQERYAEPNARLALLLGRDLPWDTTPTAAIGAPT